MSKNTRNRILLTAVAALLLVAVTVGGTMAWMTATSSEVKNTFTHKTIGIEIKEHELKSDNTLNMNQEVTKNENYVMLPGLTQPKDPFVNVLSDSVDCYVFIEVVTKADDNALDASNYLEWTINAGWVKVDGVTGPKGGTVYAYYGTTNDAVNTVMAKVAADSSTPSIISNITVKNTLTADAVKQENVEKVALTFHAYAVQADQLTADTGINTWKLYVRDDENDATAEIQ